MFWRFFTLAALSVSVCQRTIVARREALPYWQLLFSFMRIRGGFISCCRHKKNDPTTECRTAARSLYEILVFFFFYYENGILQNTYFTFL